MLRPNLFRKFKRGPQVVLPKDAGAIVAHSGLQAGDKVVDAGVGSGFLSIRLGAVVGPSGKVTAYESREEFAKLASKNIEAAGMDGFVTVKVQDIFLGIDENEVDIITLDMANSERALPHALAALKQGGACVGLLPNVEQVRKFVLDAVKLGFTHESTIEVIEREWLVRENGCRPATTGLTHTVFLAFLRKPPGGRAYKTESAAAVHSANEIPSAGEKPAVESSEPKD
ncbi:methyltransferase domain-containing protein [Candidatus Micrarchaeota archaeon]|nr:methyltransferase domain-containing protein [Candidatus Micrarchaeota archaeon]